MKKEHIPKPFEKLGHLSKEVRDVLSGYFEDRFSQLVQLAEISVKIRHQILETHPDIINYLPNSSTEWLGNCFSSSTPRKILELGLHHKRQNPNSLIEIKYHYKDYPNLNITKGFTVRSHIQPETYSFLDGVNEEKWTSLEPEDEFLLIGIALYQYTPQFVYKHGEIDMQTLIEEWVNSFNE